MIAFLDETPAGELLRQHEVRLHEPETVQARELLHRRYGDNGAVACEAFTQGAFRLQIRDAQIDSLDARVDLVPGLEVKLIHLMDRTWGRD